jgi:molecular chaperone GrpE
VSGDMASWFKRSRDDGMSTEMNGPDGSESTIEVKASVIAEMARAAEEKPVGQVGPQVGIAADGVVAGADFEPPASPDTPPNALEAALSERRSLVALCLYALDRARSAGVAERIEEGLAGVGVCAVRPDGVRFDPAHHEAGGTVATADESLDGLVAETEVVGFSDRGELLRAPIVTVYSKAER